MECGDRIITTTARRFDYLSAMVGKNVIIKSIDGDWCRGVLVSVDISLNIVIWQARTAASSTVNSGTLEIDSDKYLFIGLDDGTRKFNKPIASISFNNFQTLTSGSLQSSAASVPGTSMEYVIESSLEICPNDF
ncbi:hypothetical protein JTB14_014731 [Gonioctena quinquepunctata]|nr:hypothetical protein JTB14_014731 [Gonioctena quinquepunctata]